MKEARHKRIHIARWHVCELSRIDKSMGTESRQVVARGEVGIQRAWGIFFEREID